MRPCEARPQSPTSRRPETQVALAALSIPLDLRGAVGVLFIPLAVGWCSNAAALFFVISLEADDRRWLVAYPVALFYTCFALITIF